MRPNFRENNKASVLVYWLVDWSSAARTLGNEIILKKIILLDNDGEDFS